MVDYHDEEWLREKYHDDELTQKEIGELCGVSDVTISNWMDRHGWRNIYRETDITHAHRARLRTAVALDYRHVYRAKHDRFKCVPPHV